MSYSPRSLEGRARLTSDRLFWAALILATHFAANSSFAVDKTWIAGTNQNWSAGAFWSPSGSPTGTDDAVTTSAGTGAILVDVNASVNNFTSTSSANPIVAGTGAASGRTLTVNGNVVKTGSAATWDFRRSTGGNSSLGVAVSGTVINVGPGALNATYTLNFGNGGSNQYLESFSAGAMSLSGTGAFVSFMVGPTSGTAAISGALSMSGTRTVVNIRANTVAGSTTSGVLQVGALTGGNAGTIIRTNSNMNASTSLSTGTLVINGASGTASFDGILTNGGVTGASQSASNVLALEKRNGGTQILTRANGYTGGTTIGGGALLINNPVGAGTGAVVVSGSGALGGTGLIATAGAAGTTIGAGATLAPGSGGIGTLSFSGSNTTGTVLTLQSTAKIEMELGAAGGAISTPGSGDTLSFLNSASGDVTFANTNIDFLATGAEGWYKVFDTDLATGTTWTGLTLSGQTVTSGLNVTNLGGGLTGTLIVGDGTAGDYNDIYLQVVPEPQAVLISIIRGHRISHLRAILCSGERLPRAVGGKKLKIPADFGLTYQLHSYKGVFQSTPQPL